jgi:transcriptional regulator with XRE-family HTH domain
MDLEEYRRELENDAEYLAAEEKLKPLLDLADQILRLRLKKGWSQAELARRVGTRQANISRLESGTSNPTAAFIHKVARALDAEWTIVLAAEAGSSAPRSAFYTLLPTARQASRLEPNSRTTRCMPGRYW